MPALKEIFHKRYVGKSGLVLDLILPDESGDDAPVAESFDEHKVKRDHGKFAKVAVAAKPKQAKSKAPKVSPKSPIKAVPGLKDGGFPKGHAPQSPKITRNQNQEGGEKKVPAPKPAPPPKDVKIADTEEKARDWKEHGVKAKAFKEWFGPWDTAPEEASKVVDEHGVPKKTFPYSVVRDEEGEPLIVYHGGTHGDRVSFDPEKANVENAVGKGVYFSTDSTDAKENYAGVGPDLSSRITRLAEEYGNDIDDYLWSLGKTNNEHEKPDQKEVAERLDEYPWMADDFKQRILTDVAAGEVGQSHEYHDDLRKIAEAKLHGGKPYLMQCYLNIRNPVIMDKSKPFAGTVFEVLKYHPENEDAEPETGPIVEAFDKVSAKFGLTDEQHTQIRDKMLEDPDGVTAAMFGKIVGDCDEPLQDQETGDIITGQFVSEVFKAVGGFDGIRMKNARDFFSMPNMGANTDHWVAWHANQIKSVGNRGTFEKDNPNFNEAAAPLAESGRHAPKGGISLAGKKYIGGQFIPGKVLAQATHAEKAELVAKTKAQKHEASSKPPVKGGTIPQGTTQGSNNYHGDNSRAPRPPNIKPPHDFKPGKYEPVKHPADKRDMARYFHEIHQTPEYREVQKRLGALRAEVGDDNVLDWSISKNLGPDGKRFTPEREALHDKIVSKFLNPKAATKLGETPRVVFLSGPPGAGKTSSSGSFVNKLIPEHSLIAADEVKEMLPEFDGWNAAAVHTESQVLAEGKVRNAILANRHHALVDMTCSSLDKTKRLVDEFAKAGYEVHLVNVSVPSHEATARAWDRFAANAFGWRDPSKPHGRYVPVGFAFNVVDSNPDKTYKSMKDDPAIKSWTSVSNAGPFGTPPKVLEEGNR